MLKINKKEKEMRTEKKKRIGSGKWTKVYICPLLLHLAMKLILPTFEMML